MDEGDIMNFIKKNYSGILLCLAIAILSYFLGQIVPVVGGPVFAILIGMIITIFIKDKSKIQPGVSYTSKKILQYAVILLGFGLNLGSILKTGAQSLPIIVSTISISLIVAFVLFKIMKIPSKIAVLIGVGSSICGGSAIAATAPVIDANDEEIAQSISVIFMFNIIAALIFPTLGSIIGLGDNGFGLFAGTAINDTSSVTAAATAWDGLHGSNTLDTATIVKLTRTLAIIPITLILAFYQAKKQRSTDSQSFSIGKIFPFFIIYFVLASLITTIFYAIFPSGTIYEYGKIVFGFMKNMSKFLIIMAMAGIGINTDILKLVKSGGKPIFLGLCCWISIIAVSLIMQHITRIY